MKDVAKLIEQLRNKYPEELKKEPLLDDLEAQVIPDLDEEDEDVYMDEELPEEESMEMEMPKDIEEDDDEEEDDLLF